MTSIKQLARNYEPYGSILSSSGTWATIYGFDGEQQDSYITDGLACQGGNCATGLIYLRARYMSSSVGRFLTKDKWQGNLQLPMSYNKWAFVSANPINFADPLGFWQLVIFPR